MKILLITAVVCLSLSQVISGENIVELAQGDESLSTLLELIQAAGLEETLAGEGPFTVFAPTNEAFEMVEPEVLEELKSDPEKLKMVLLYHVLPERVVAGDLENDLSVATAEGSKLRVNIYLKSDFYPGFVTVNGIRLSKANIEADNGVIHIISMPLLEIPSGSIVDVLSNHPEGIFSTLVTALEKADLVETLSGEDPFTVFAPTNEAFEQLDEAKLNALLEDTEQLKEVLLSHVIPGTLFQKGISWMVHQTAPQTKETEIQTQVFKGGVVKVASVESSARIVDYDMIATNGVIHAIDTPLHIAM
eukprot:maker-scaffold946_size77891-snap-gene-0.13 protein:Tk00131 transcript:maker-scaffold946_size77891-snap-gene-0.13-mRNA-1 annotation:"hypothetical protein BRAFLDRAFT_127065"